MTVTIAEPKEGVAAPPRESEGAPETAARGAGPSRRQEAALLAGALLVVVLAGLPSLLYPFGRDQAMFAYIADQWRHGALPYRDAWDIKPPGIFAVYAMALQLFGRGAHAPRVADLLCALLTAAGLYLFARRRGSATQGAIAASLFGLGYFTFGYWETAQVESYALPLTVGLVYALFEAREGRGLGWWAAAGVCLGLLVVLKTSFVPLGLLALMAMRRSWRGLTLFGVASALPVAFTLLYFARHHALGYIGELLTAQAAYAKGDGLARLIGSAGDWVLFIGQPAIALCVLPAALWPLRPERRRQPETRMVLSWFGLAVAILVMQQRFSLYHGLPALPPLALLAGGTLSQVSRPTGSRLMRRFVGGGTVLLALALVTPSVAARYERAWRYCSGQLSAQEYWAGFRGPFAYSYAECAEAADYVRPRTRPEEPILVYAFEPAVYFLAQRNSPTRHLSTAPIFGETQISESLRHRWLAEQLRDIAARPPRYVLTVGCLHCVGLAPEHGAEAQHIVLGGHRFVREARRGKFTIYRRMSD